MGFIDDGKLDAGSAITEDALVASGLVRRKLDGVRVLAKGDFSAKVALEVTGASKAAFSQKRPLHGISSRTEGGEHELGRPRQSHRSAQPHPIHARPVVRLPAGDIPAGSRENNKRKGYY